MTPKRKAPPVAGTGSKIDKDIVHFGPIDGLAPAAPGASSTESKRGASSTELAPAPVEKRPKLERKDTDAQLPDFDAFNDDFDMCMASLRGV